MVRFKCLYSFKSLMAANINTHNTVHHTQIIWHYTCIFIILLTTQPGALNTLVPLKMLFMHKKLWKTLYLPVSLELAPETAWTDQSFLDSVVCQYCWLLFLRNWRKTEKKQKNPSSNNYYNLSSETVIPRLTRCKQVCSSVCLVSWKVLWIFSLALWRSHSVC